VERDSVWCWGESVRIVLLRGIGYRRNVSLARLLDHAVVAAKFAREATQWPVPDVILCSLPTVDLARVAVRYGMAKGVPVVLDIRDLWPDLFAEVLPRLMRILATPNIYLMRRQLQAACRGAVALTGSAPGFVRWGLKHAGREAGPHDRHFPFGYERPCLSEKEMREGLDYWREHGLVEDDGTFIAVFFGTMNRQFDLETVICAGHMLADRGRPVRFVLCGTGEQKERLARVAGDTGVVILPGWVDRIRIVSLMRIAKVGLAPYRSHVGFEENLPNKIIEYLAGGLPVVTTLSGYAAKLLRQWECGMFYQEGDAGALAEALERLAIDPMLCERMGRRAVSAFEREFDAGKVYREMGDYLIGIAEAYHRTGSDGSRSYLKNTSGGS